MALLKVMQQLIILSAGGVEVMLDVFLPEITKECPLRIVRQCRRSKMFLLVLLIDSLRVNVCHSSAGLVTLAI